MGAPISQKRRSYRQTFTFDEEHFTLDYKGPSGYGELDIDYLSLPDKPVVHIDQHRSALYIGIAFIALGVVIMIGIVATDLDAEHAAVPIWAGFGAFFLLLYYFSKSEYTVYANNHVNFSVIHDKKHDAIVNEIRSRRIQRLRAVYGDLNPLNKPEAELNKFRWLFGQQAISEEELNEKIALIEGDVPRTDKIKKPQSH